MSTQYTLVAPCFFGTESTLHFEVKRLGAQNIQVTDGRVRFEGDASLVAAANINLRTAERVLLLLASYKAATFDELFDGCYRLPERSQEGHRQTDAGRPQDRRAAGNGGDVQSPLRPAQE